MKKVLISMLFVCLTLCLFVGCNSDSVETLFKEKIEPTPPTPTTKTISVKEDNVDKFTFEISTTSTTWEDVKGKLTEKWTLNVNTDKSHNS